MKCRNTLTLTAISATLLLGGCAQWNNAQLSVLHGLDHFNHFMVKAGRAEQALPQTIMGDGKTKAQIAKAQADSDYPQHILNEEIQKHGPVCGSERAAVMMRPAWLNAGKPQWSWQSATVMALLSARSAGYEAGGWNAKKNLCFALAENEMAYDLLTYDAQSSSTLPDAKKILNECERSQYWAQCLMDIRAHHLFQNNQKIQARIQKMDREDKQIEKSANESIPGL
jgi:hypothetical protein